MKQSVKKTHNGLSIQFLGTLKKQQVVSMVQNCAQGKCSCMSPQTKEKIKDMKINEHDEELSLELVGDVTVEEITQALQNSKVLNND